MFDWSEYLVVARHLAEQKTEAGCRSAVSRAYYSAFCSARNWLDEHDLAFHMPAPGESHKAVWDRYDQGPERQKKQIATEGRRLRGHRNWADYENNPAQDIEQILELSLTRADRLLKLLDSLRPPA